MLSQECKQQQNKDRIETKDWAASVKAGSDFKTFTGIRASQTLSLGPICEESTGNLEDGVEEFIQNAAHKNNVIENVEEVHKCGGKT